MVKAIEWTNKGIKILDQRKLPHDVQYITCTNHREVVECIKNLSIRGAPAIGIAAAMGMAWQANELKTATFQEFKCKLSLISSDFLNSRPTAVNIKWAVERMLATTDENKDETLDIVKTILTEEAKKILEEDIQVNREIGKWGAMFIKDGDTVLTHCNAGALATGGYGTATAAIRTAIENGKRVSVIADETRPVLQGARLTAWELMQDNIPVTLITDNAAGALMKNCEINLCFVGTDRTARNGDVANKIGTYSIAVLSKENSIPFYVAAPLSSIDFSTPTGTHIPIEERGDEEVINIFSKCKIAPEGIKVRNIAFDITDAKYISAIVTEKGAFKPQDIHLLEKNDDKYKSTRITD
ncbi:aIF-2BI family translation initiation factor [Candidatus Magnetoovum chiemensis]|nr:aIF-2BI family translation initiation factor [Candidatus Magnetoovum chiemensis]